MIENEVLLPVSPGLTENAHWTTNNGIKYDSEYQLYDKRFHTDCLLQRIVRQDVSYHPPASMSGMPKKQCSFQARGCPSQEISHQWSHRHVLGCYFRAKGGDQFIAITESWWFYVMPIFSAVAGYSSETGQNWSRAQLSTATCDKRLKGILPQNTEGITEGVGLSIRLDLSARTSMAEPERWCESRWPGVGKCWFQPLWQWCCWFFAIKSQNSFQKASRAHQSVGGFCFDRFW